MSRLSRPYVVSVRGNHSRGSLDVVRGRGTRTVGVLSVDCALRAPLTGELRRRVLALRRRGERIVVLDLSRVRSIDAAGVGQLVQTYNSMIGANGMLRIVHVPRRVRELLERAGLFGLLSGGRGTE
jgi:anti-anti-sigma factor